LNPKTQKLKPLTLKPNPRALNPSHAPGVGGRRCSTWWYRSTRAAVGVCRHQALPGWCRPRSGVNSL